MHECFLFIPIIACDEMQRMNWKEIKILYLVCNGKISYALNYKRCDFVGNYEIFMLCWSIIDEEMLKKVNVFLVREFWLFQIEYHNLILDPPKLFYEIIYFLLKIKNLKIFSRHEELSLWALRNKKAKRIVWLRYFDKINWRKT